MIKDEEVNKEKLNKNSFYTISVIGKGAYAKVILVKKKSNNKYYAMKVLKKQKVSKKKQIIHIKTERDILVNLTDHPFLINMNSSFQTKKKLFFILEYCPGGELFNLLQDRRRLTEPQTRFYTSQMILAIAHLHKSNVVYRDLKPENVLINHDGYIKITDFGLSRMDVDMTEATTICGTPEYLAPEVIRKEGYGKPFDWWTLGSIIYEMLVGIPPFYTENRMELFNKIKYSHPLFPKYLSVEGRNLIRKLLNKDPSKRLGVHGAREIMDDPWFKGFDWEGVIEKKLVPFFIPKFKNDLGLGNFDKEFTEKTIHSLDGSQSVNCKTFDGFDWNGESLQKKEEKMEIED